MSTMLRISSIVLLFTFVNILFAQQSAPASKVAEKQYSESEVNAIVMAKVEKNLEKVGRAKIVEYAKELLKKEDTLQLREYELQKKEQELSISIENFKKQVIELQASQSKLIGCVEEKNNDKNKRISHMVEVISGMKPATAAEVMSVQDAEISVEILGKLEASKVSKIFNLMDKEISARLQKQYMTMKR